MSSPLWKYLVLTAALVFATSSQAHAQGCGDADNNGTVTVTDGVQTLRAAAGLASSCSANVAACDPDGSGTVTVTDGVNVLRKAAGIAITESCVNAQVARLLRTTVPVFGDLTKLGTGAQSAGTDDGCENVDGDATFDPDTGEIFFTNCQIEGFLYDGSLGIAGDETTLVLAFDLDAADLTTGEASTLFGDLTFRSSNDGAVISGSLDTSFDDLGTVAVTFEALQTDVNGNFIGGSLLFDASESDIDGVTGIRIGFATTTVVPVSVFFADQTQQDFSFNLDTGELIPVSN